VIAIRLQNWNKSKKNNELLDFYACNFIPNLMGRGDTSKPVIDIFAQRLDCLF